MNIVRLRARFVALVATLLAVIGMAFAFGASPAAANLPDTWTYNNSNADSNGFLINCGVKWHQHSSGTNNWTPIAFDVTADGPTIFQTTLAHYADPSNTRYGTWGPYDSTTGYKEYSAYIVSDNKYDDHTSSQVLFHFVTGSGDYPCSTRPPA